MDDFMGTMDKCPIYLAGKVNGPKLAFRDEIQQVADPSIFEKIDWKMSDGKCHSDHSWGICSGIISTENRDLQQFVVDEVIDVINECKCVVAYVNTPDAFGTIAEIASASAKGIATFMCIDVRHADEDVMHDAYWFISHFPHVWPLFMGAQDDEGKSCGVNAFWPPVSDCIATWCICESPVERRFWRCGGACLRGIRPQYEYHGYRLDFAFPKSKLAIEIDGHEYHSTKEARTRDSQRDAELMEHGWRTIRFTGSDVTADTRACVESVSRVLETIKGENSS